MQFLIVTRTLLLSAIRKRLYTTLLASLLAPILLLIVLLSIPDLSSLNYMFIDANRPILVVSSVKNSENCYLATLLEGSLIVDNSSLKTSILIISAKALRVLRELSLTKQYNYTSGVVLSRDLYEALKKPRVITVLVNQDIHNYTIAGLWSSNIVLLIDDSLEIQLDKYVCLKPRGEFLSNLLGIFENDLLNTAVLWIFILSLIYMPIVYIAQRRVIEALKVDVNVLVECGVSTRRVLLSIVSVLVVLHVIIVLYISALGVVLVYTGWSLLSYILPLPMPTLRAIIIQLLLFEILLGFLTAYPACRGVIE